MNLIVFRTHLASGNVDSILVASRLPAEPGFSIEVKLRKGAGFDGLLEVQRSSYSRFRPRIFKTLDGAARFLRQEGIARFYVALDMWERC
jgi:hypothetical protein